MRKKLNLLYFEQNNIIMKKVIYLAQRVKQLSAQNLPPSILDDKK